MVTKAKTAEAAQERRAHYLTLIRNGKTKKQAEALMELGPLTVSRWRTNVEGFREAEQEALTGQFSAHTTFPSFPKFREAHFAYEDRRKGIHPKTGRVWVNRAVNSFFQMDADEHLRSQNRLIIVMPPAHIKTTYFAVERAVYDLMRDRSFRITTVTKAQTEARKIVDQVKMRLSEHDYYHEKAELLQMQGDEPIECPLCKYENGVPFAPEGRSTSQRWAADSFQVAGAYSGEKDYSMEAKGFGSQIQGVRADRIVIDDLQDPRIGMTNPQDAIDKLEWMQAVILGRVFDYQQVVICANYFAPDDFAHVAAAKLGWPVIEYPAILYNDPRTGKPYLKPKPLSPETWTMDALKKKEEEVGARTWHFTWLQMHGTFDRQTFKRDTLEASRSLSHAYGDVPAEVTHIYIGVDPATAATGYCAMVVWGLNAKNGDRYLLDVFNKTGMLNWDRVTNQIEELGMKYKPRWIVVEGNNTQKGFINSEKLRDAVRRTGAKLDIYQTVTGTGARNEQTNFDITTIGSLFEDGKVTLPYQGSPEERQRVDDFITQLCNWRTDDSGHSIKHLTRDMVMALLFAESKAFEQMQRPTKKVVQTSRAPGWAQNSYRRFKRRDDQLARL